MHCSSFHIPAPRPWPRLWQRHLRHRSVSRPALCCLAPAVCRLPARCQSLGSGRGRKPDATATAQHLLSASPLPAPPLFPSQPPYSMCGVGDRSARCTGEVHRRICSLFLRPSCDSVWAGEEAVGREGGRHNGAPGATGRGADEGGGHRSRALAGREKQVERGRCILRGGE